MEKRALLAIAISFVILLFWTWMFPPPKREPPIEVSEPAIERTTPETEDRLPARDEEEPLAEADPDYPETEGVAATAEREIVIETAAFTAVLTNRGGRLVSWRLNDYVHDDGEPVELVRQFEEEAPLPLSVDLDDRSLAAEINDALFEVEEDRLRGTDGGAGRRVTLRWSDGRGVEVLKAFTFHEADWLVDVELEVLDRGRPLDARVTVGPGFGARDPTQSQGTYYYAGQGLWNLGGEVTHFRNKKMVKAESGFRGRVYWAGLEDQYFAALIIPGDEPSATRWHSLELMPALTAESDDEVEPRPEPVMAVSVGPAGAQVYLGPKEYTLLSELGRELDKAVWFSSNGFLYAISKYLFLSLEWLHHHVTGNWGLAIILATTVLRIVLFPVNQYAMVSMRKTQAQMQRVQPKIKAIKAKYAKKKDAESRQKVQQETMELYRKEGINPMGGLSGCLPLLAQFPILIGFYNMLTVTVELRGAPFFGWIQDLSQKDPYWVFPLLMGVTMFAQQKMAMSKVKDPTQAQQQKIMMFMPFFFTYICLRMPSGMVIYWFVNNLLGIGQQWLVNRHASRLEAASQKA